MKLVKHETCLEYFRRRLSEGWKCVSLEGYKAVLLSPDGIKRELDLRGDVYTGYSASSDAYIYCYDATYVLAQGYEEGGGVTTGSMSPYTLRLGQRWATYYLYRGFFFFDTSSIPSNAEISAAILSLYGYSDHVEYSFDLVIQNGQPIYPHDPVVNGDYNCDHYSGNGGSKALTGWELPTGFNDPDNKWNSEPNAYDGKTGTFADSDALDLVVGEWNIPFLEFTHAAFSCSKVRFRMGDTDFDLVDIDVEYEDDPGNWHHVCQDAYTPLTWNERTIPDGPKTITKARIRTRSAVTDTNRESRIYGFQFMNPGGSGFSISGYNNITMNATGRGWIQKGTGAITKLCIRSSKDIDVVEPTGDEYVEVYSSEKGAGYQAKLVVTYTVPPVFAPTVTTQATTSVEETTATGNGNITATGGENCHTKGFCYKVGTTGDPTTADSKVYDNGAGSYGTGAFSKSLTGLSTGTNYRVRAYAINSAGTGYGTTVQILTKPAAPTNVAATDGVHTDKVVVTWTKSDGATKYEVFRDGAGLGELGDVATYEDTGADAPIITPGVAAASDGLHLDKVALSLAGQSVANGTTHTYKVKAGNVAGWSGDSGTNTGYRGHGVLTYQWQRSSGDSDGDYSNIDGATTASYDDTGAPADGSGRYYQCVENATGAAGQTSSSDRGYRATGWSGKISGVTNPAKVMGVAKANIAKVKGVA